MFDCPFYFKMPQEVALGDESTVQSYLDNWRQENGEDWLESVGPVMKNRELRNMERSSHKDSLTSAGS